MADDDWRVCVTFKDEAHVRRTAGLLREHQVTDDARRRLGNRIVVSEDRGELFLYAGSENAAREAGQLVRDVLARHQMDADVTLSRWHSGEERWEDAGVPQTRRWKFLSLFADNEDAVNDLAKAVRRDAPANAAIHTEEGVFVNGVAPLFPD